MEDLVPPSLICIRDVRQSLEDGVSVKVGVETFLARGLHSQFRLHLLQWWGALFQKTSQNVATSTPQLHPLHELFFELLERGLRGDAIASSLERLEEEILKVAEDAVQKELDLMPFRLMVPSLLFFFPALMSLLLGPLMAEILDVLGR
ncbi:MAG: hypothetical protein K2X47_18445 [Bdellovibrionales bacterium]|nr:hypothetical protein [Bdellovibrionales bacterium]